MKTHMRIADIPTLSIRALVLITLAGLALPITAAAENQSTTASKAPAAKQTMQQHNTKSNAAANAQEPMEEITVIGQKQLFTLHKQIVQAEDHAYEIFDRLNDDDDYDIHCRMVAFTGTRIKQRVCLPNFYRQATAAEAQQYLGLIGETDYAPVVPSSQNVFAYKIPILKAKVVKLATEHPEMLEALRKLVVLKKELHRENSIYFGGTKK